METYAAQKTADSIARAAEYAMVKSKKLENPLYVSPENIFPEMYGSHPKELKDTIINAREAFADMMVKKKKVDNKKQGLELAKTHIKATFDVGHANIWRKYFVGSDKEFDDWMLKQVDNLNKEGIIGHVHVSDNFGYDDEHIRPGRGNAPIKPFIERMKAAGIKDVIVEPNENDFYAMLGGWEVFGRPVYGVNGSPARWSEVEHSYFGKSAPPYFLYGEGAPDQKEWTLWSGARLE